MPCEAFVSALLHDLAKLVLGRHLPQPMVTAVAGPDGLGQRRGTDVEAETLGLSHGKLGGLVASSWGLPAGIPAGITHHHAPEDAPDETCRDVAAFVGAMAPTNPAPTLTGGDAANGQNAYMACGSCHGQNGEGNEALTAPPLAGQSDWYLARSLEKYKAGMRGYDLANDGLQHSSRIVRCTLSTAPLEVGRPGWMRVWTAPSSRRASPNSAERNSEPLSVSARSRRQPQAARSAATRRARPLVCRAEGLSGVVCSSAQA